MIVARASNRIFNMKRGLAKLQKVVTGNPLLDRDSNNYESDLVSQINQCKRSQTESLLKMRRNVKAF